MNELFESPKRKDYRSELLDFENADAAAFSDHRIQTLYESGAISLQESFALAEKFGELEAGVNPYAWSCFATAVVAAILDFHFTVGGHDYTLLPPGWALVTTLTLTPISIAFFVLAYRRLSTNFNKFEFGISIAGLTLAVAFFLLGIATLLLKSFFAV